MANLIDVVKLVEVKVLVVVAHPDDVDFGSGGTVATWIAEVMRLFIVS